ncbi:MAG: hypothetical protein WDM77_01825 [Steroidobacteraceae bacterium]
MLQAPVALSLVSVSVTASAQASFSTFAQVDYFWTQSPQTFQGIFQAARTQTVRIAILGDSQETNPGGKGQDYIPP